ncbi:MAG: acyltransferase [Magnetococcales bacterium]|nr:acyltransferase [Magnetococcales bacterium]
MSEPNTLSDTPIKYRADIDGLRALAVLAVLFFHAGSERFSGGFVGVDIFFVISGFLITSIITREIQQGHFSILTFYERRIRRIFPALFSVIFFSTLLAGLILMPDPFQDFGRSVAATTLFGSNILFWMDTGYFAAAAETKPLLHTWSLAVEEQFYIFFPLLLTWLAGYFGRSWKTVLYPLALLSFLLNILGMDHDPSAPFFLAPFRAWELLIGAFLALGFIPPIKNTKRREGVAWLGLGLIAWSIFGFSRLTPFPGHAALVPCLGAAALLHSGANGSTRISRFLSLGPVVFIGLISYSLYLWHWPLIVFAKQYAIEELSSAETAGLILLSLIVASLSWRYIERPFRGSSPRFSRKGVFSGAALAMITALTLGLIADLTQGWPGRIPEQVFYLANFKHSSNPRLKTCLANKNHRIPPEQSCRYGADTPPTYAVWGDSHADSAIHMIGQLAGQRGESVQYIGFAGCPPVMGVNRYGQPKQNCLQHNHQALDFLSNHPTIQTVFIMARYSNYILPLPGGEPAFITDLSGEMRSVQERRQLFKDGLNRSVVQLRRSGKKVVLVYPIPETGFHIPNTLAKLVLRGEDPAGFSRPTADFLERNRFILSLLDSFGQADDIRRIRPHEKLCDDKRCLVYANKTPLYKDGDHLSLAGASYIEPLFLPIFTP